MVDILVTEASRAQGADETAAIVRASCEPMPAPDDVEAFSAFFDRFADAKVILLGEATHGTSQFYRARAAITRRLIEKHGFSIVAVEADWPDAARIDRHVRHRAHEPSSKEAFARFPTWMWRNAEMHDFVCRLAFWGETPDSMFSISYLYPDSLKIRDKFLAFCD
jgi:erythromycin esterase-like protein